MLGILVLLSVVILLNKDWVVQFFHSTGSGQVGLFLDGMILLIFLVGLVRMILLFLGYSREQDHLMQFVKNAKENTPNPAYNLPANSIIASRYQMIQIIARQHAPIPQAALSASLAAHQSAQMTLVRFVHNILIISGVFGTAVSLSMALMSMSGLLDSTENLQKIVECLKRYRHCDYLLRHFYLLLHASNGCPHAIVSQRRRCNQPVYYSAL
jgi:hypothetical protein